LSISKAIIEKLGGLIGFETEPNHGTVFFFLLPEWCGEQLQIVPLEERASA
jgi:signal transduction histidine kinase